MEACQRAGVVRGVCGAVGLGVGADLRNGVPVSFSGHSGPPCIQLDSLLSLPSSSSSQHKSQLCRWQRGGAEKERDGEREGAG